jgi:hypothetical protein
MLGLLYLLLISDPICEILFPVEHWSKAFVVNQ